MNRFLLCWLSVAVLAGGCAGAKADRRAPADLKRASCERAPEPTAECIELLTRPAVESRSQVQAAEAARRAEAFRGRLADLRAAEEQRQVRRRPRTATVAVARLLERTRRPVPAPGPESDAEQVQETADAPSVPPGSGVATETPAGSVPVRVLPGRRGAKLAPPLEDAPTPEQYLRAGRCLLEADRTKGVNQLSAYRRGPSVDRAQAGQWALVLTDADALVGRITREIAHRKLVKKDPVCMSSSVRPVVALLRSLVGPPPASLSRARGYGRGLSRLEQVLEVRAGLPRAE